MKMILLALAVVVVCPLHGQMHMHDSSGTSGEPAGISETRMGSGTSWLPDAAPMHDTHLTIGKWTLMLHGQGFLQYDWQGDARGSSQLGAVNWAMAAVSRSLEGGRARIELRSMLSAEPWTIGSRGYPLLLQSGESYQSAPLHDRQHPHDLFMELAVLFQRSVARNLALELYVAPVGEPALGPVAFPHRPSAAEDPLAPISHHWQDGSHITFGVLTAGAYTRTLKLEASWFNGREPDENRTNFDYAGRKLDSYSARISVNPDTRWSLSAWYGYLRSPEGLHPDESLHRLGAAILTTQGAGAHGAWSSALIFGANMAVGTGQLSPSVVLESALEPDACNAVFGRVEYVRKTAEELVITSAPATTEYPVDAVAVGYVRTVGRVAGLSAGAGVRGSLNVLPSSLETTYGSRTPLGVAIYVRLRPAAGHGGKMGMHEMRGDSHD